MDMSATTTMRRPPQEVFDYVANVAHDVTWRTGIVDSSSGWAVQTATESIAADRLIVTVGGQSYPGCGTTGDGYAWLTGLGHSLVTPRPALVPLVGGRPWTHQLSGLTLDAVQLTV